MSIRRKAGLTPLYVTKLWVFFTVGRVFEPLKDKKYFKQFITDTGVLWKTGACKHKRKSIGNLSFVHPYQIVYPSRKMFNRSSSKLLRLNAVLGFVVACLFSLPVFAQQSDTPPVIVQPGAPGQPTRILPPTTRAKLPPRSVKDVEFMQGMIMHHAQAVEMTAWIDSRTENKDLRLLGARISQSQSDEMKFMKRWLEARGEPASMQMSGMDMSGMKMEGMNMSHNMLMPGMLTSKQMSELEKAKGAEFDKLFLKGMIQHHGGALVMVKDLYDTAGAGQDAELFNFATDVDSGQRAEIRIMQTMLGKKP